MISQKELRRSPAAAAQLKAQNKTLQIFQLGAKCSRSILFLHLNVTMTWQMIGINSLIERDEFSEQLAREELCGKSNPDTEFRCRQKLPSDELI